jgi:hypothetical protein
MHISASPSGTNSPHTAPSSLPYASPISPNPFPTSAARRCPTGEARITPGFDLPAKFVIHTVGPIYANARTSAPLLEAAFRCVHLHTDPLCVPCSQIARILYTFQALLLFCLACACAGRHVSRRVPSSQWRSKCLCLLLLTQVVSGAGVVQEPELGGLPRHLVWGVRLPDQGRRSDRRPDLHGLQ